MSAESERFDGKNCSMCGARVCKICGSCEAICDCAFCPSCGALKFTCDCNPEEEEEDASKTSIFDDLATGGGQD